MITNIKVRLINSIKLAFFMIAFVLFYILVGGAFTVLIAILPALVGDIVSISYGKLIGAVTWVSLQIAMLIVGLFIISYVDDIWNCIKHTIKLD